MKKIILTFSLLVSFISFADTKTEIKNDKIEGSCTMTVTFSRGGRTYTQTYSGTSGSAGGCATWEANILEALENKGYKINDSSSSFQSTLTLQPSK